MFKILFLLSCWCCYLLNSVSVTIAGEDDPSNPTLTLPAPIKTVIADLLTYSLSELTNLDSLRLKDTKFGLESTQEKGKQLYLLHVLKREYFLLEGDRVMFDDNANPYFKVSPLPAHPEDFINEMKNVDTTKLLESYLRRRLCSYNDNSISITPDFHKKTVNTYIVAQSLSFSLFARNHLRCLTVQGAFPECLVSARTRVFSFKEDSPSFYEDYSQQFLEYLTDYLTFKQAYYNVIAFVLQKGKYALPFKIMKFAKRPRLENERFAELCQTLVQHKLGKIPLPEDFLKSFDLTILNQYLTQIYRRSCFYEFHCNGYWELCKTLLSYQALYLESLQQAALARLKPCCEEVEEDNRDIDEILRYIEGDKPTIKKDKKKQNKRNEPSKPLLKKTEPKKSQGAQTVPVIKTPTGTKDSLEITTLADPNPNPWQTVSYQKQSKQKKPHPGPAPYQTYRKEKPFSRPVSDKNTPLLPSPAILPPLRVEEGKATKVFPDLGALIKPAPEIKAEALKLEPSSITYHQDTAPVTIAYDRYVGKLTELKEFLATDVPEHKKKLAIIHTASQTHLRMEEIKKNNLQTQDLISLKDDLSCLENLCQIYDINSDVFKDNS